MADPGPHYRRCSGLQTMFYGFDWLAGQRAQGESANRFLQWLETRDRYETMVYVADRPDSIREATDA